MRLGAGLGAVVGLLAVVAVAQAPMPKTEVWRFDRTDVLGGHATTVLGHPQVIESPYGKAVQFNGVDDALYVGVHPLAGAATFTWEVIFRPDGGDAEQRFFHFQEQDASGANVGSRMLFELRIVDGQWCLDSFATDGTHSRTLLNCKALHPVGQWYRITAVYDGKTLRNYVGDELQGEGDVELTPQKQGHASMGTRIDKRNYFKGAILMARMTPRALPQGEFLKMPGMMADPTGK
jgi:Concanavalin A-like lectin/glucanases superfamily